MATSTYRLGTFAFQANVAAGLVLTDVDLNAFSADILNRISSVTLQVEQDLRPVIAQMIADALASGGGVITPPPVPVVHTADSSSFTVDSNSYTADAA